MSINFAFSQLSKALDAAESHADAAVRGRAAERASAWRATVKGMASGHITVGDRQPVRDLPVWVTPQVVYGGFATGTAVAEGVEVDEIVLAAKLEGRVLDDQEAHDEAKRYERADMRATLRRKLFSHYLSDAGLAELYAMLDDGGFLAKVPEDTALPTLAWLLRSHPEDAAPLLDALLPLAHRLRFAPRAATPRSVPRAPAEYVWRHTADEVVKALHNIRGLPPRLVKHYKAITVGAGLKDRFLALWYEMDDDPKGLFNNAWFKTATKLMADLEKAGYSSRRDRNLQWLSAATCATLQKGSWSSGAAMAERVRLACDDMVRKRGAPGSARLVSLRAHQAREQPPLPRDVGVIVAKRLGGQHGDEGMVDPEQYLGAIAREEATQSVPEGSRVPASIVAKVRGGLAAPIHVLVGKGLIPSAEVYATILSQQLSRVFAASYPDESLRELMGATYTAFANRRSLLLLNLAAQVRITELPWVAAAAKFRSADTTNESKESILKAAREVLQSWPGTILPNRLLSQFNSITNAGGLGIDFVEELAVDIFCDMLSPKFTKVAAVATKLVSGTVYAKYYFIPELGNRGLMSLCNRRVKALQGDSQNYMMRNRLILEQVQILTTHNLATLVLMGLTADWEVLAVRAWTTTRECLEKQLKLPDTYWAVHVKRLLVKNAAWAWRQAIFFLAMAEKQAKKHADKVEDKNDGREVVRRFIRDARAGIPDAPRAETKETSPRLDLILDGLASVLEEADTEPVRPKRIFLGWLVAAPWVFMNDEQLEKLDASSVPLSQVSVALV